TSSRRRCGRPMATSAQRRLPRGPGAAGAGAAMAAGPVATVDAARGRPLPDDIRLARLDSGIRVVTERMPDAHSVTTGFWVDAGSRDETPELAGASHFLEHLLFKGTDTRSAREIAEAIEAVGGDMNAFTAHEQTVFYVRVPDVQLEAAFDVLADVLWNPAFRVDDVESERRVILEE